ncbi:MAG: putative bifunctional diguanylate cyclase/phosphodiesterase [Pseudonocardiaceae bacterium]
MSGSALPFSRMELARAWADALLPTAEVPQPGEWVEEYLREQVDHLVDALGQPWFSPESAAEAGADLVAQGFTGEQSLGRTVELLGQALPRQPELCTVKGLISRVASQLGALVSGYSTALRHRVLARDEARFRTVFAAAPMGMLISRLDGTITQTNGALTAMLSYTSDELAVREVSELFHPDDAALLAAAYQALRDGTRERFQNRVKLVAANGDTTSVALTVSVLRDAAGSMTHHVTMVEDFTDRQLLEQRVRHQSLHDLLTGLPNRLHFAIHLEALLERERSAPVMLCKINLDGFAVVNDGLGQGVGDLLLRSVAGRFQALVAGERAIVARFDADEFAILIEESPTTPNAAALAASINAELSEPVYLAGRGLAVSACVGVVRRTAGETDAKELIRAAEATLHRVQRTGRGQWGLYDPPADAEQRARYALATAMPEAWESGQVTLSYQPMVRLDPAAADAGRTVALAALLRWDHPERGAVAHDDCVAHAEQTGLVLSIGPWMLEQACEQLRSWRDQLGFAVPPVRVDLTTYLAQDPDLVAVVHSALKASQLRPEDIQLGMPVEVVVAGHGDAEDNVGTLADIGVHTVLTRYGQALGNLALLESLPVQGVELAGRLVRMAAQPDSVMGSALIGLVPLMRRTGTAVVVAGIDSAEQAQWWRDVGADSARGTAFGPPVTQQAIPGLLSS